MKKPSKKVEKKESKKSLPVKTNTVTNKKIIKEDVKQDKKKAKNIKKEDSETSSSEEVEQDKKNGKKEDSETSSSEEIEQVKKNGKKEDSETSSSEEVEQVKKNEKKEDCETSSNEEIEQDNQEGDSSSEIEKQSSSVDEETLEDKNLRVVFMKGIPYNLTEEELKKEINLVGKTVRISIPMTGDKNRNKGFAFIEFIKESDAKKCLKLNNKELFGRKVNVNIANNSEKKKKFTLKVNNLPYKCNKQDLIKFLEVYGTIKGCHIPMEDYRTKGFAFVFVEDEETYKKILNNKIVFKDRTLFVKDADEQQNGKNNFDIRKKNFNSEKKSYNNDKRKTPYDGNKKVKTSCDDKKNKFKNEKHKKSNDDNKNRIVFDSDSE